MLAEDQGVTEQGIRKQALPLDDVASDRQIDATGLVSGIKA